MPDQHIERLENEIHAANSAFHKLGDDSEFRELLRIIHNPGWTTPAELAFVESTLRSLTAQATQIAEQRRALVAASRAVAPHREEAVL